MDFDVFLNALYKALLHSIWQGMFLALLGGVVGLVGKKWKSSSRYTVLTAALLIFFGGFFYTFLLGLSPTSSLNFGEAIKSSETLQTQNQTLSGFSVYSISDRLYGFYDYYMAHFDRIFVFSWFVVLCFKLIQMFIDLIFIRKLRSSNIRFVDSRIEQSLLVLIHKMGLKNKIDVFESPLLKSPVMIGVIKPMILFPIGLATMMPIHQIEAILAHELAHIKRKDYLVNLIQSIIEVIFFFNLPVIWFSSMIRQEREQCCDEIALELTGNKAEYVNTLVQCLEHNPSSAKMAFANNRKSVLTRVKRIFGIPNPTFNQLERFFLAICLVTTLITVGIMSDKSNYWSDKFIYSTFMDQKESDQEGDRVNSLEVIELLKKEDIIEDPGNFSVKITNFALYVDGIRQPKNIHQQVLKDYVKGYQHRLHYTVTVKSDS